MTRIKIQKIENIIFSTEVLIRIGDINHANHLSHVAFITILEEARTRFLRSCQVPFDPNGIGYILSDLSIMYLRQGKYGQILRIDIGTNDFTARGFDIVYKVSDSQSDIELARAKTGLVFFDYRQQKVTQIPSVLGDKLGKS